jgi:hypothetical protein
MIDELSRLISLMPGLRGDWLITFSRRNVVVKWPTMAMCRGKGLESLVGTYISSTRRWHDSQGQLDADI